MLGAEDISDPFSAAFYASVTVSEKESIYCVITKNDESPAKLGFTRAKDAEFVCNPTNTLYLSCQTVKVLAHVLLSPSVDRIEVETETESFKVAWFPTYLAVIQRSKLVVVPRSAQPEFAIMIAAAARILQKITVSDSVAEIK